MLLGTFLIIKYVFMFSFPSISVYLPLQFFPVQECYQTSSHSAENDNTKDITEEKVSTNSEKCRKTLRLSSDQIVSVLCTCIKYKY